MQVRAIVRDVIGLAGVASIAGGAGMVYPPAGFIIGGLFAVAGAILAGRDR